jgi:hypothetical protein
MGREHVNAHHWFSDDLPRHCGHNSCPRPAPAGSLTRVGAGGKTISTRRSAATAPPIPLSKSSLRSSMGGICLWTHRPKMAPLHRFPRVQWDSVPGETTHIAPRRAMIPTILIFQANNYRHQLRACSLKSPSKTIIPRSCPLTAVAPGAESSPGEEGPPISLFSTRGGAPPRMTMPLFNPAVVVDQVVGLGDLLSPCLRGVDMMVVSVNRERQPMRWCRTSLVTDAPACGSRRVILAPRRSCRMLVGHCRRS